MQAVRLCDELKRSENEVANSASTETAKRKSNE